MGVRKKETLKPMLAVRHDFVASLQNLVDQGNLFLVVVETALQNDAVSSKVADMVRERAAAFKAALYGNDNDVED